MIGMGPGLGLLNRRRRAQSYISQWLLRDDFTTPESAPIASPRTAEPGPGTWTVTDPNSNVWSISSGILSASAEAGYNQNLTSGTYTRAAGVTLLSRARFANWYCDVGWNNARFAYESGYLFCRQDGQFNTGIAVDTATYYQLACVLRSAGLFGIIKGGAYTDWSLVWVSINNSSDVAAYLHRYAGTTFVDYAYGVQLTAPYDTDYGIAINRVASPTTGETTTMEADAIVEFTWTPAAGETLDLMVRRDSDTDTWSVVCAESTATSPNTIKLIERNGGDTERSSAAQTFSAGTAYRIVVIVYGTTIKTYVANVAKNSYSSASHNQTSTGVKASGFTTGSNLVAWPRTLSGAAKAALDEVANA